MLSWASRASEAVPMVSAAAARRDAAHERVLRLVVPDTASGLFVWAPWRLRFDGDPRTPGITP
jgi:hypothetical protein